MPRDVTTRWNSTFDMLDFAFAHRKALDLMTQDRENGLREYEMSEEEWEIVRQLRDALKVSAVQTGLAVSVLTVRADFQRRYLVLLSRHSQPRHSHPGYGPH
jgi:hypothetical protein